MAGAGASLTKLAGGGVEGRLRGRTSTGRGRGRGEASTEVEPAAGGLGRGDGAWKRGRGTAKLDSRKGMEESRGARADKERHGRNAE